MRVYLSRDTLSEGEQAGKWRAAALDFFGKLVMKVIEKGKEELGDHLPRFSSQLHSPGEEAFFFFQPYFAYIRSVVVSVHDEYFLSERLVLW